MQIDALVFDAYGTLFDVHSVVRCCDEFWPGKGDALSSLWRSKQLEYTWLRSLMGRYASFDTVTQDALRTACEMLRLDLDGGQMAALMDAYRRLDAFPEVGEFLAAQGTRRRAILSNGTPAMLNAVVGHNGLAGAFDAVLSVDGLKIYKPDPRVYRLAVDALGIPPDRIGFVSSNCWDVCGAQSFGFRTFWINRAGAVLDRLGVVPVRMVASLSELSAALA